MFKVIFIFAIGLGVGYSVGFKDARTHTESIVTRVVNRVGGHTREDVKTDVDQQMRRVDDSGR